MRVTIAVPADLHQCIQMARGHFLMTEATDVSYSAMVEMLVRSGIAYLAEKSGKLTLEEEVGLNSELAGILEMDEVPYEELVGALKQGRQEYFKGKLERKKGQDGKKSH